MKRRLLDLFCGAGGATRGYQLAGFHVTGVDINPQPRYVGDAFIQGDAIELLRMLINAYPNAGAFLRTFDAIHASPPCQAFTPLRVMKNAKAHDDLVTPMRGLLLETGRPWVIENVPGAPVRRDLVLCGSMFGLGLADGSAQLRRHRWFELSFPLTSLPLSCSHDQRAPVPVYGQGSKFDKRRQRTVTVVGKSGGSSTRDNFVAYGVTDRQAAMGIDWMKDPELSQAIPPAYTEFIGKQLMRVVSE